MKMTFTFLMALCAIVLIFAAGCDSGGSSAGSVTPVDNYSIVAYTLDGGNYIPLDNWDGTCLTSTTGRIYFGMVVAGTRGGAPKADFQLWKSDEPANWSDPIADLKGFKKVCDLAPYAEREDPSYLFFEPGRYLVRAYAVGTNKELTHVRLDILKEIVEPITDPEMSVTLDVTPADTGRKSATITVTNSGRAVDDVKVLLDEALQPGFMTAYVFLPPMIEWHWVSSTEEIGVGMTLENSVTMLKNGVTSPISDIDLMTQGVNIGSMTQGEVAVINCVFFP